MNRRAAFFFRPLSVLFIAVALVAASLTVPVDRARGEAGSALLGRYSCSHVKSLATSAPQQLFAMWAEEKILGDGLGTADMLAKRGNINIVLANIGELTTAIQGLDAVASADWKKAAEVFSDWLLGKAFELTGSGLPGAVWTVCKELNQFAVELNEEILDINIKTYAGFAENDSKLLERGGETYFLKTYLDAELTKPDTFDMVKRRASLMEYAKVKLGMKNFPGVRQWPENWNLVRSVARSMLNEVQAEVEKRRKFKQLQGELKSQLTQLKRELAIMTTFQGMLAQVRAMTCLDETPDCLSGYNDTLTTLEGLILDAGDIKGAGPGVFDGLERSLDAANLSIDGIFRQINTAKSPIEAYCEKAEAEYKSAGTTAELAKTALSEAAAKAAQAEIYRDAACTVTAPEEAEKAVAKARDSVTVVTHLADSIYFLGRELEKHAPPAPVDFSSAEAEASDLKSRLNDVEATVTENADKRDKLSAGVAKAKAQVKILGDKCKDMKDFGVVTAAMARLDQVVAEVPDVRADVNSMERVQGQMALIFKRLSKLKVLAAEDRACLQTVPDISGYLTQIRKMAVDARKHVEKTTAHADTAAECLEKLKDKCRENERRDDDGNCVCIEGYETVDGRCLPSCKENEERGPDGVCICKAGYERVDGACRKVCGANAQRNAAGDCDCIPGYEKVDGVCVEEGSGCTADIDCPEGYVCDRDTGDCLPEQENGCWNDSDCPDRYVCDRRTGECVSPLDDSYDDATDTLISREDDRSQDQADRTAADQAAGTGRRPGADALDDALDDMQEGLAGKCGSDDQCPAGYVCRNGKCVEKEPCASDADCPSGTACVNGACVKKLACAFDSDCPPGRICSSGRCVEKPACSADSDCASGYVCRSGKCVKKPDCSRDSDCPSGTVCKDGACVKKSGCRSDSDCPQGKVCKNGVCVDKPVVPTPPPATPTLPPAPPKDRTLSWHAATVCAENEGAEYRWRWMVSLKQTGSRVSGNVYFHKCPGGGRVAYRFTGEEKSNGSFVVSGEKSGGRGGLYATAAQRRTFTLRQGKAPSPGY